MHVCTYTHTYDKVAFEVACFKDTIGDFFNLGIFWWECKHAVPRILGFIR